MKTTMTTRLYALAMSTVMATAATLGTAVMITTSSGQAPAAFESGAAVQAKTLPSTANL